MTPVVLEARAGLVRLRMPRQIVERGADPLVQRRRDSAQPGAEVPATGKLAGLEVGHELVPFPHLDAGAVVLDDRVEGAVEMAPAQGHNGFELVPRPADVLQPIGDADELHRDPIALYLGEVVHAPRCVYQRPLAPSWKTTVFSPLSSTTS